MMTTCQLVVVVVESERQLDVSDLRHLYEVSDVDELPYHFVDVIDGLSRIQVGAVQVGKKVRVGDICQAACCYVASYCVEF